MSCDKCVNNSGFIHVEATADEDEKWTVCSCRVDKVNSVNMKEKHIEAFFPLKLKVYPLTDFLKETKDQDESYYKSNLLNLSSIVKYVDNPKLYIDGPDVLWLWGNSLCGKTSLSLTLGDALILAHKKVRYIVVEQLSKLYKNFNADDYAERIAAFEKFEVYIIDDLFSSQSIDAMSAYDFKQFYSFVKLGLLDNKKFIFISDRSVNSLDNVKGVPYDTSGFKSLITKSCKDIQVLGDFKLNILKQLK